MAASSHFDSTSQSSPADSSAPNSCPNSVSSSIIIQNIGSLVPIKLTTTNWITWSALFAPIFRRYNLTGLIDGSLVAPPMYLLDSSGTRTSTVNPQYITWFENDQNILIWINSTLSDSLIPYTVGVTFARDLWAKLESRLATTSQSHIHELRSRLRTITKGDSTAVAYLQQIEEIADALATAGAPIADSELISVLLHGLPPEYDAFVDTIQFRLSSTTVDELHGLLLSKEIQLANRKKASSSVSFQAYHSSAGILPTPPADSPSQAYFVSSHGRGFDRNFFNPRNFQNFSRQGQNFNRQGQHFSRQGQQKNTHGSKPNFHNFNRRNSCQICRQSDHEAIDCPHRLNPNYGTKHSQTAYHTNTASNAFPPSTASNAPTWLLDTGASSHMTNSYTNLQSPEPYSGPDQVYIGDGKGLPIIHSGSSCLPTSTHTFDLHNVLHVPDLKQDLISANRFIVDNWYTEILEDLKKDPESHGGPPDCIDQENAKAISLFENVVDLNDAIEDEVKRVENLIRGIFAGNIFDLGSAQLAEVFSKDGMSFLASCQNLVPRPWVIDDLDAFKLKWTKKSWKKASSAVIFVDNSGADIILGILPFARELLRRGTQVVLAANDLPSINDVTYTELIEIISRLKDKNGQLKGVDTSKLLIANSGNDLPVIDLSRVSQELAHLASDADLVILEGMGRGIETNLYAQFKCDSLKIGMVKHPEVAQFLGGRLYDCVFKYNEVLLS
ncbi:hypothetical protein C1H46_000490 [Malus baccata]|uniref:Uncharacterized protein n=1 Tax=Malus baccata TaxID=106549 RepID=A0A540NS91_MALBA|nr:hypothetical protein C1H46_000490 [Malus baccata]